MGGVRHNLTCTPKCPGGIQVLEGWQIANNVLCSADVTLPVPFLLTITAAYQMKVVKEDMWMGKFTSLITARFNSFSCQSIGSKV